MVGHTPNHKGLGQGFWSWRSGFALNHKGLGCHAPLWCMANPIKAMFYAYILHLSNDNLYAGSTDDLRRRYKEHICGKVESTKDYRPLKLIFYEAFLSKKDAERRENYFKTAKGKKMLKVILREYLNNNHSGIV